MRVITKISTQKKTKNRFNIFINNEYAFSVSEDVLVKYNLHKGMDVKDNEITDLLEADSLQKSYLKAIHYISYRMRSIKEVNDYLIKKEVPNQQIEKIIVKLLNRDLLDDEKFAQAFIKDQINQTSKGPTLIKRELLNKGVKEQVVNEQLHLFTYNIELEKALKWAERRTNRKSYDSYRKRIEKLRVGLLQRGFTHSVIQDVLPMIENKIKDGTEWQGLVHQADKLYRRLSKRYDSYDLINRLKSGLYTRGFPTELIDRYVAELTDDN